MCVNCTQCRHSRVFVCEERYYVILFQLAHIIGFVNAQPALTNSLETEIASLTTRVDSLRSRTDKVQGSL